MTTRTLPRAGTSAEWAGLGQILRAGFHGAVRLFLDLDAFYRERQRLAELDDRTLRDIGVTRADVEEALSRPEEHFTLARRRGSGRQL